MPSYAPISPNNPNLRWETTSQTDIGLVLTVGGLVSLFGQVPGGAIVDSLKSLRAAAAIAVIAIGASAFALAAFPIFPIVLSVHLLSEDLHKACVIDLDKLCFSAALSKAEA